DQARARLELIEFRIGQAAIRAPIGGTVIAGDLGDLLGASIELGQALYEVAAMDDLVVIARVPDSDIRLIQDAVEGDMATKAFPAQRFDVVPERIVPLAQPDEGTNTFEVRASLAGSAPWMRPGMEGLVKFDTGERTLIDIGTRRIRDTIRLWLWW
ncbi:MAG: efflux RND transporter periplasmic adaptor subunit, partial [Planctomycetota bacterium]